jgi:hypothetical protein
MTAPAGSVAFSTYYLGRVGVLDPGIGPECFSDLYRPFMANCLCWEKVAQRGSSRRLNHCVRGEGAERIKLWNASFFRYSESFQPRPSLALDSLNERPLVASLIVDES